MLYEINKDMITCLRISDFNTIDLKGVTDTEKSPFFLLTKGVVLVIKQELQEVLKE